MLTNGRRTIFFLLTFFISSQVGLHFWPKFSYVYGARVDYLSPTLFLIDILIILFIALSLFSSKVRKNLFDIKINKWLGILLGLFVLDLVFNAFFSKSPLAHIFGMIKIVEFALFGFLVAKTFIKEDIPFLVDAIALSAIVSSALAISEFIAQSSIGGLWYFWGERTFNLATIGISSINLNHQILRPYAAFSHPNVLAFFLLTAIAFIFPRINFEKRVSERLFLIFSITISSLALVLTFSRVAILLLICLSFYEFYTKGNLKIRYALVCIFGILSVLIAFLVTHFFPEFFLRGIDLRQELFSESIKIFLNNPYFGIGINNFFINQAPLIKVITPVIFQPVHNIFILALLSLGFFGWWIFPYFFALAFRSLLKKIRATNLGIQSFYRSILFVLAGIIIVGMFDHFFLTVEQGQIILALIFGLSFTSLKA